MIENGQINQHVTIYPREIDFFNSMQYRGQNGEEHEVSGQILLDHKNNVQGTKVFFGGDSHAFLPQGALTFHKHTILDTFKRGFMSTDVPSPTDMISIALAIMYHGAQEHIVFTPNFTYTITWYKDALDKVKQDSSSISVQQVQNRIKTQIENLYESIIGENNGKNYGKSFCESWINQLRKIGFDIKTFKAGDKVRFQYGPVIVYDMDGSVPSIVSLVSSYVTDENKRKKYWTIRKIKSILYAGFGIAVIGLSGWAIQDRINTN
jgi:hypothetical protein